MRTPPRATSALRVEAVDGEDRAGRQPLAGVLALVVASVALAPGTTVLAPIAISFATVGALIAARRRENDSATP